MPVCVGLMFGIPLSGLHREPIYGGRYARGDGAKKENSAD